MPLVCASCKHSHRKSGILLKCLHKICLDCLAACLQPDGRIRCAECRVYTPCPPPGHNHLQFLVDGSMEERRLLHVCPLHDGMRILYHCSACREGLCETCKKLRKHAPHKDQIGGIPDKAAALLQRLEERIKQLGPAGEAKEVDKFLVIAGISLRKRKRALVQVVAENRTLIQQDCNKQVQAVEKRKQELISEVERWSKQQGVTRVLIKYREALQKAKDLRIMIGTARSNEDLLKLQPNLIKALKDIDEKTFSHNRISMLACPNLSNLTGQISAMGEFVDVNRTNLSLLSDCRIIKDRNSTLYLIIANTPIILLLPVGIVFCLVVMVLFLWSSF